MRDDKWLELLLESVWQEYFPDVERVNDVMILFGFKAKTRLGSIKKDKFNRSIITVTGHFRDPQIPEFVVIETVAHELIHYADGFSSDHPRNHKFPHRGSIIKQEMEQRGLLEIWKQSRAWLDLYWGDIIKGEEKTKRKMRKAIVRRKHILLKKQSLFNKLLRW